MSKKYIRSVVRMSTAILFFSLTAIQLHAQPCNPPVNQVVLYDLSGTYYAYWKPVSPPLNINFSVKIKCTNLPPCAITVNVTSANVLQMNGGYLGVVIPPLPSPSSTITMSILPPGCTPQYFASFVVAMDIITDNLDIVVADCDSDTCLVSVSAWKNLKNLSNYTTSKCGGAVVAVPASTVKAIDAPFSISLKKNAAGKWQLKTLQPVPCDTCCVFNFQVTCPNGTKHYVQDTICFNYTGPPCRIADFTTKNASFSLYPNPAGENCTLELSVNKLSPLSINIYNMVGEKIAVVKQDAAADKGVYEFELPMNELKQGLYFVEVRANDLVLRKKLVKF